ncbi:MAG TPA: HAMP domain-containing histidine kinase [Actinobacteria bacterium]|nr:HAMP domain-containing histidine kinase [Actinomycetota bacterium]
MKVLLGPLAAALAALAAFEITMRPTAAERTELTVLFLAVAVLAAAAAWALPRWARRSGSIRTVVVVSTLSGYGIVAAVLVAAAGRMFLSTHDLGLLFVALGFGVLTALGFSLTVSNPLTDDLRTMATMAAGVAGGDLTARTGVDRADELGRLAAALDAMAATLEASEAQRAKDRQARRDFFTAIGHDLRSPLAAIRAALEALQDGVAADPDRYLASIAGDVAALEALVADLYLLARIESGGVPIELVPVDVAEIADETVEVLRPMADRDRVRLRVSAPGAVVVPAGPEALGRVLRNLMENAVRHAPPDSEVVVSVSRDETGARVVVADDGPGFDERFLEVAFEPFTRPDPSRRRDTGGTGLGLAIASGFIEAFGGEMWAEPGPGGRVGFVIPAAGPTS